jgi:hypothetical protein
MRTSVMVKRGLPALLTGIQITKELMRWCNQCAWDIGVCLQDSTQRFSRIRVLSPNPLKICLCDLPRDFLLSSEKRRPFEHRLFIYETLRYYFRALRICNGNRHGLNYWRIDIRNNGLYSHLRRCYLLRRNNIF